MVRCEKQMPRPDDLKTIPCRATRLQRYALHCGQVSLIIPNPPKAGRHYSWVQEKGFA